MLLFHCEGRDIGRHEDLTWRSEKRLAAAWANARCPRWMGSKVPPKNPIFIFDITR